MIERIEGIVLDIVRHNDMHNVVTLYTRQRGRMAFLVPVGKSREGRVRNSLLTLMSVVSANVNIRSGKELFTLRKVEPERVWHAIYSNPLKTSLIFFLAEFCHRLVRQYPADAPLWDFILGSLEILESLPSSRISNFHIAFLLKLLPLTGIEPSATRWDTGDRFNMQTGEMEASDGLFLYSGHSRRPALLSEEESRTVPPLLRMNYRNMHLFRLSQADRHRILNRILDYYSTHLPLGSDFKTLPVLRELFS